MEINPTQHPAVAATSPARRAVPRLLLATLVALPLTLAACSTEADQPPAPLPMPTVNIATTSAAATEPATEDTQATPVPSTRVASETPLLPEQIEPPVPSDVALENSADGAEAYAYFLFQAWWYLINTHDIDWWDANIPDCDWKTQMRDSAVYQDGRGVTNETAPIHPHVISRKVNPENGNEFGITLHTEVGDIYNIAEDGSKTISAPAKKYELIARLLHDGNSWKAVTIVTRGVEETQ